MGVYVVWRIQFVEVIVMLLPEDVMYSSYL